MENALKIAGALGVSVERLVTGAEKEWTSESSGSIKRIICKLEHFSSRDIAAVEGIVDAIFEKQILR